MAQHDKAQAAAAACILLRWLAGIVALGLLAFTAVIAVVTGGRGEMLAFIVPLLFAALSGSVWLVLKMYDR
ncbi:hypothetical protein [Streptomyces boninensis]|uniref:hypothetical protein n=1 Tax=Streptomyces boninensis TaxID=2039455 RepID=UPI003B223FC6